MATQVERRERTRHALLEAGAATLVERGLGWFTTEAVADRAGLSNGALFRHFPTRLDLVAATVAHVLARLRNVYAERFAAEDPAAATPQKVLGLLWQCVSAPELAAVFAVYAQCRTDASLRAVIEPIVADHGLRTRELVADVNARHDEPHVAKAEALVADIAILSMQGLAINHMVGASTGEEGDLIDALTTIFRLLAHHFEDQ
jgi:AcrR family transcriptional regulator